MSRSSRAVFHGCLLGAATLGLPLDTPAADSLHDEPIISPRATRVEFDPNAFRSDPEYGSRPYDPEAQILIYGGKSAVKSTRPMLELGRPLYQEGPFRKAPNALGEKNLIFGHLMAYGDWRTAMAYNDNGAVEQRRLATRLNLDVDLQFTATERIHAFFRPFDQGGRFSRIDFGPGADTQQLELDGNPDALFFEGDLASIASGFSGDYPGIDMPFAFGLMPLLFQNGVWVEDAFTGAAFTIPARNSALFDISNMDFTFFVGIDKITTGALRNANGLFDDHNARIYGMAAFIEANQGYYEFGYAYTQTEKEFKGLDYHNITGSFTRRYFHRVSNSIRVIANFGQNPQVGQARTADGVILLLENSLITSLPSTLIPYFNAFIGFDRAQSLARDAGAGGILKNTGIVFETDGLTGFPTLDASGQETYGGALGLEYLFDLDQQIVVEAATVQVLGGRNKPGRPAPGDQYGLGIRYQLPLTESWILRADGILAFRSEADDLSGVRLEMRYKF